MIAMITPLAVGNALRLFFEPPRGATMWRVLRKAADTFTGHDDPNAFVAYEGCDRSAVDAQYLQNGTLYHYRVFYFDGTVWTASETATGTPNATYEDCSTDALTILRERLALGLQVEVKRGALVPQAEGGIRVLTAPPAFEDTRWPVVTVQLVFEQPGERAIGELIEPDQFGIDDWSEYEGWLARAQIAFVGWCLNPDERIELRKALRRIIVANLPVFDAFGMVQVEMSMQDVDDIESYPAPVYQAAGTFTCLAPVIVRSTVDPITDVQTEVHTL